VRAEGLPRLFVNWDDALHTNDNHTRAAAEFASRYGWHGTWTGGGLPDSTGNCYVRIPRRQRPDDLCFHIPTQETK
jgi:hypothetical protein